MLRSSVPPPITALEPQGPRPATRVPNAMEIRSHQTPEERRRHLEGSLQADITRPNREGIERAMGELAEKRVERAPAERSLVEGSALQPSDRAQTDRLELSSASRALADAEALPGPDGTLESPDQRAERIASLSRDLAEGRLFSAERLERAAARLLGED